MRLIISTVGTSIISNLPKEQPTDTSVEQLLTSINREGEVKASAETNSLSRIISPDDCLLFLCSDTPEGNLASEALTRFYQQQGLKSSRRVIAELNYKHDNFMSRGLKSLVNILINEIRVARQKGLEVHINATGGFKAEIAYATLVGLMFHVPVYYIHEIFQDIICMPPAPIDWDLSLLAEHEDFFFWITDQYRRTEKVNNRLQALPDRIQLLLEDDADGYTTLSPAGWVYYESYKEAIHDLPPVMVSDAALRLYRKLDSTRQKLIDREVHKLRIEPLRKGNSGQISSSDCYIYPHGDCAQRIYYYEKDNRLYLCEIAFHELNYEELNQSGVRKGDYQSFEYWK